MSLNIYRCMFHDYNIIRKFTIFSHYPLIMLSCLNIELSRQENNNNNAFIIFIKCFSVSYNIKEELYL
uniref:Uncharacterized protein n=1 Tax=Strongyloides venezuelensis TaxID=75913 RepID=A0A0K0FK92_STRVS